MNTKNSYRELINKTNIFRLLIILLTLPVGLLCELAYSYGIIRLTNTLGKHFVYERFLFFWMFALCITLLVMFWKVAAKKFEVMFLIIALTMGVAFGIALPTTPVVSWDDETHYNNSIYLSAVVLGYNQGDIDFYNQKYFSDLNLSNVHKAEQMYIEHANQNNVEAKKFSLDNAIARICYIPEGIVMFVLKLMKMPFNVVFVAGRLVNLLEYVVLMYLAIRKLKSGKMLLMVIGLFPTSLFIASNYSYDAWILGWSSLALAYLIEAIQTPEKPIAVRELVIMLTGFVVAFAPKPVYFPMLLLLLLIPRSKFANNKMRWIFYGAIGLAILLLIYSFVAPMFAGGGGMQVTQDDRYGEDINGNEQVAFILGNPLAYVNILYQFFKGYFSIEEANSYTSNMAYMGFGQYIQFPVILFILAMFAENSEEDKKLLTWKNRIVSGIMCLGSITLVATAMYVACTVVGALQIEGCQPRYLIPLLFTLTFITFRPGFKSEFLKSRTFIWMMCASLVFVQFITAWQCYFSRLY